MTGLYVSERIEKVKWITLQIFGMIDRDQNSISKDEWRKAFLPGGKLTKWFELFEGEKNADELWEQINTDVKCDSKDRVTFPEFEKFLDKYLVTLNDAKIQEVFLKLRELEALYDSNVKEAFRRHDKNEDDFLNSIELKGALADLNIHPSLETLLNFMGDGDDDYNGTIDLVEFKKIIKDIKSNIYR